MTCGACGAGDTRSALWALLTERPLWPFDPSWPLRPRCAGEPLRACDAAGDLDFGEGGITAGNPGLGRGGDEEYPAVLQNGCAERVLRARNERLGAADGNAAGFALRPGCARCAIDAPGTLDSLRALRPRDPLQALLAREAGCADGPLRPDGPLYACGSRWAGQTDAGCSGCALRASDAADDLNFGKCRINTGEAALRRGSNDEYAAVIKHGCAGGVLRARHEYFGAFERERSVQSGCAGCARGAGCACNAQALRAGNALRSLRANGPLHSGGPLHSSGSLCAGHTLQSLRTCGTCRTCIS